jgi:sugar lactone lactonase YvrE
MIRSREVSIVADARGLVESPRWHQGQFWFADWSAGEILSIDDQGACQVRARAPAPPLCFDFAADEEMLIVSAAQGLLLKQHASGEVANFARLGPGMWNEIVVDGRGNAYINGPSLLLIRPGGQVSQEADGFAFPNGMAMFPDNRTLIVAESHAKRLTAFDVSSDGHLSGRRVWAQLEGPPDGICIDQEGAIWYADVPNSYCRRVKEGGEVLDEVRLDRGAFSCALGGPSRQTLMITAAKWFGMDRIADVAGTGRIFTLPVSVAGSGWP